MAPDGELHALVAELAAATPEDVAAVLAMLNASAAARLRSLLAAYAGMDTSALPPGPARLETAGLSDWLAARVVGETTDDWRMTPAALSAVRTLAAAMPPDILAAGRTPIMAADAGRDSLGLFGRRRRP